MEYNNHIGRIKVIQPNSNVYDSICICPHCGAHVRYGEMCTVSGINNCPECNLTLHREIENDKSISYDLYARKANNYEYEPYRYKEGE